MLFTPFHVPHPVRLTAQGEERRGQMWSSSARLGAGLDEPGLLLATPPHCSARPRRPVSPSAPGRSLEAA